MQARKHSQQDTDAVRSRPLGAASSDMRIAGKNLRAAVAAYGLDLAALRHLVATPGADLRQALRTTPCADEITALLDILTALLTPAERQQLRSPANAAALLMVQIGHLDQEQLTTLCLDTRNRIQQIHTVYQGSVNASMVRISEVFKPAIHCNSFAVIIAHNHPSGDPNPSPEDVLMTKEIIDAGRILNIDVLDHLVIGHGKYVSLREGGLAFGDKGEE